MADLEPVTRLLYIGLWNFVDDEGYIEYKPRKIKMQIFPGNDYDVETALLHLLQAGRLGEFDSDQGKLLQVLRFQDHQRVPHPSPTKFTGITRSNSGTPHEDSRALTKPQEPSLLKGKERKGKESNVQSSTGREFDEFWKVYPRKEGKQPALRAYLKARKSFDAEAILKGAQAYALLMVGKEKQHIKMAQGWLNDRRFEDDLAEPVKPLATSPLAPRSLEPAEHAHKWLVDGSCMLCTARRDREDTW
jgi:hypothetical protein